MYNQYKHKIQPHWDEYNAVGKFLVQKRIENGDNSNKEFAEAIEIDPSDFSNYIRGNKPGLYGFDTWFKITMHFLIGCNGRRAINSDLELDKYYYQLARLPGPLLYEDELNALKREISIARDEQGLIARRLVQAMIYGMEQRVDELTRDERKWYLIARNHLTENGDWF